MSEMSITQIFEYILGANTNSYSFTLDNIEIYDLPSNINVGSNKILKLIICGYLMGQWPLPKYVLES